jgi:hypothetical protein
MMHDQLDLLCKIPGLEKAGGKVKQTLSAWKGCGAVLCFFLVPGSFCSEWRARWRELLDIHILYSMGNKELLRVTRFVSYSL